MWEFYLNDYYSYLKLERSLSENSISAYLNDIKKLRDFTKETDTLGYAGHMTREGHQLFAPVLQEEIFKRWKISLTMNGKI